MRLTTLIFCEDVRNEIRGTNTIVGQFSSLRGGLNQEIGFKVFFGLSGFLGMAKIGIAVIAPNGDSIKTFTLDEVACFSKQNQYVGNFDIKKLVLREYGLYEIVFSHKGKEIGRGRLVYNIQDPKGNIIYVGGKAIEVPRVFIKDDTELHQIAKCFLRRYSKLERPYESIKFISQFNKTDGIGSVSALLVDEMLKNGVMVNPVCLFPGNADLEFIKSLDDKRLTKEKTDVTIINALPSHVKSGGADERVLLFTYWENDTVEKSWVNIANTTDALFVPSNYVKNTYRTCGVTKPIHVYRQPVDPIFQCYDKSSSPRDKEYTITFIGTCIPRKGLDILVRAFDEVFKDELNVRLRIHTKPWAKMLGNYSEDLVKKYANNSRYFITTNYLDNQGIYELLKESDLLVAPSRSEGLGLVPIQAIITGTPVIVPRHTGFLEYCDAAGVYTVDKYEDVQGTGIYSNGKWCEPDFYSLCELMRYVRNDKEDSQQQAREGSKKLRTLYDVGNTYVSLKNMINECYGA